LPQKDGLSIPTAVALFLATPPRYPFMKTMDPDSEKSSAVDTPKS
jgi:hypothetical protein